MSLRVGPFRFSIKAPPPQRQPRAPDWVTADADPVSAEFSVSDGREELTQRRALMQPAVFVSAMNVAKMAAAHLPRVVRITGPDEEAQPIQNHPFEHLLWRPNPWMSSTFVLWFTYLALPLRGNAFLYLADDLEGGDIQQIWPIPPHRVEPIPSKDTEKFIEYFKYIPVSGAKPFKLPTENVCWIRQPNIFDLTDGLSSVSPLGRNIDTAHSQDVYRANFFGPRNAQPRTLIGIKKDVSVPVFNALKHELLTEFDIMNRGTMIHRAGDVDVNVLGMTAEDLGILEFARHDAAVFKEVMGWSEALGAKQTTYASAYAAEDIVTSYTVWPLMKLVAGDMTVQIIHRRYGEEFAAQYKDIRPRRRNEDRADYSTYNPDRTVNENRKAQRQEPVTEGEYAEVCETVPVRLLPYHFQQQARPQEKPEQEATLKDLRLWERKALRRVKEGGDAAVPFESDAIPDGLKAAVSGCLMLASTPEQVRDTFGMLK